MYITDNIKLQNYLAEKGIYPLREQGITAYYKKNKQLYSKLDSYYIEKILIRNRI